MFRFENPEYLMLLIAIPLMIAGYLYYLYWRRKVARAYGDAPVVRQMMPEVSGMRRLTRFQLQLLAVASIIVALANPQVGSKIEKVERKGVDIVIALDVSNSMLAEDIKPSRIERARQSISRLIDEMENDRIGLVVFAGKAYTQLPVTSDYSAAKLMLATVRTDMVPVQGTAIGSAIEMATVASKSDKNPKAIIVISDGENHEDDAIKMAEEARKNDIKIYTIGMGLAEGAPIPIYQNNQLVGYKRDRTGATVISRLDETMLQQIAQAGDGVYVRASNTQDGLRKIFQEIGKLDKTVFETHNFSAYESRYRYFVALPLILLAVAFMVNERKSKWAQKTNIFKPSNTKSS